MFFNSIRGTCMRQNVSSLEILFKRPLSHSPYPVYPIARTKWFREKDLSPTSAWSNEYQKKINILESQLNWTFTFYSRQFK